MLEIKKNACSKIEKNYRRTFANKLSQLKTKSHCHTNIILINIKQNNEEMKVTLWARNRNLLSQRTVTL